VNHIARGTASCNAIVEPIDIDQLELVADWKDDLGAKIARAQLRFELIGLDGVAQDRLKAEVEQFKRVCRVLTFGRGTAA